MRKLPLRDKVCFLISWALVLMCSVAEREYYPHPPNLTWDQARNHCQKLAQKSLMSDFWVGLRKNYSTSNSSSMAWSHWANGDPLIFQNWYPGCPVLKSSFQRTHCCVCPETTTPATTRVPTFTDFTTQDVTNFSALGEDPNEHVRDGFGSTGVTSHTATDFSGDWQSTAQSLPPPTPTVPVNTVEDSCVAMLSFGAWVEKNCAELLPSMCYEEPFVGPVEEANVTSESAVLKWSAGPGVISHYNIEVQVHEGSQTKFLTHDVTYDLVNLIAGTNYSVQVFPVKCGRALKPQQVTFYTTPNKVENLTVTKVKETSVFLSWKKPAGNVDFYLIQVQGGETIKSITEGKEVGGLMPGSLYTFTVLSGVNDNSSRSEEFVIQTYTKPGIVSNLRVVSTNTTSLLLSWVPPKGSHAGFLVEARDDKNATVFDREVNTTQEDVTGLPVATKITLSVTAFANSSLEGHRGDTVTIFNYTAPEPISDLKLSTTFNSLSASWTSPVGYSSPFTVKLQLDGENVNTTENLEEPKIHFDGLKTAARYTVIVYTMSGPLETASRNSSKFTKTAPPTDVHVDVTLTDKKQITLKWTAPANITTATYRIRISSSFWGRSWSEDVHDKTSHTIGSLESGTRYNFEVQTVADNGEESESKPVSHCTEAEKTHIDLSMLCSSAESLLCDKSTTREHVFEQLQEHFKKEFGDNIFWKLEKRQIEN